MRKLLGKCVGAGRAAAFCAVGLAAFGAPSIASAQIVNPSFSNSYGDWAARWWQWIFSIPAKTNPNLFVGTVDCARGQAGNVWFLGSNFGGDSRRSCAAGIPSGKALFFPLITAVAYSPKNAATISELRQGAGQLIDIVDTRQLWVSIDGRQLMTNLADFRATSPTFTVLPPSYGLIAPPGKTVGPSPTDTLVADGYWLLVPPLAPGPHSIAFGARTKNGYTVAVSYAFIVLPPE